MSTAAKTRKFVPAADETYFYEGEPTLWEVLINGEVAGTCQRRESTTAGYYGAWTYTIRGQKGCKFDETKRECVKAIVAAWKPQQADSTVPS